MKNINWKVILISIGIVLALVLLCVILVQSSQNRAINLEEQVMTASSDIEIQEKRRVDLIHNLVDTVQEYSEYEAATLTAIIEQRGTGSSGTIDNASLAISAVAEQYPELQANTNYQSLMTELSLTENLIAEYRGNYNKRVKDYNRYVRQFPARIFLNITGYESQNYAYLEYGAPSDAPQNLFD